MTISTAQQLIPSECLKTTNGAGRNRPRDSFTDVDLLLQQNTTARLYGLQYCIDDGTLIGLRFLTQDTTAGTGPDKLGTHGITDKSGTCRNEILPSQNITNGTIYFEGRNPTLVTGFDVYFYSESTN